MAFVDWIVTQLLFLFFNFQKWGHLQLSPLKIFTV